METDKEFLRDRTVSSLYSESVGEYSLPDYNTDVKKLLLIKSRAIPSGKFIEEGAVEFSGIVYYDIVYLDSENNITGCSFSTDYDISVKCSAEEVEGADIDTRVSNYSIRLLGPRRFSAKAGLQSDVHIAEGASVGIEGDTFSGREPETRSGEARVKYCTASEAAEREYAEELIHLDGVIADEVEVLLCSCENKISSVTACDGGAELKGELCASALVKIGDGMPVLYKRVIPVSEIIACDIAEGAAPVGHMYLPSVKANVNPDEDGVSITVSVITESVIWAFGNETVPLVHDCYLTDFDTVNEYDDFDYTEHMTVKCEAANFSSQLDKTECGAENIRNYICAFATPRIESVTAKDELACISGEIRFNGIACEVNEDGELGYVGVKYDIPFTQNVNINCQIPDNSRLSCNARATDATIELDGGRVYPACNLYFEIVADVDRRKTCVTSSSVTDVAHETDNSVVTVYYPDRSESLFEVAKKFHTSVMAIASDNALSETVMSMSDSPSGLAGVKKLIIK